MTLYRRYFHLNTTSIATATCDTTEGKSLRQSVQEQVNALDGVWGAELTQYTLTVSHLTEVVSAAELDELVLTILHETAKTHKSLFPYVTADGKLRRETDKDKDAAELKDFEVCPNYSSSWGYEQNKSATPAGRHSITRVFELNALIAGLDANGAYNQPLADQFQQIVGGQLGLINGVWGVEITHTRVAVTFYADMTPVDKLDKKASKVIHEVFGQHHQFFPHLRRSGKPLEVSRIFTKAA